jgi:hypothetical protein
MTYPWDGGNLGAVRQVLHPFPSISQQRIHHDISTCLARRRWLEITSRCSLHQHLEGKGDDSKKPSGVRAEFSEQ